MQLEEECRNYLYEAKNFLRDLLQVFNLLFATSFEEASEWTVAKKPRPSVIAYAEANFQDQPDHIRYLQQFPACIDPYIRMRNAVEHPKGFSGELVIRNFRFEPDGSLVPPDWRRDKDGQTEYGPIPIIEDMRIGVENLLILAEDILIMWAVDHPALPGATEIRAIPEDQRNPTCPIKYRMDLRPGLLGSLTKPVPTPASSDNLRRG